MEKKEDNGEAKKWKTEKIVVNDKKMENGWS